MQFLRVKTELESSLIQLESSLIQFLLVRIPIRELSNSVLTSKNWIRELFNSITELCN